MPFNEELRKKLRILKEEYENGLLPEYIYGQLCKQTIDSYGDSAFEDLASLNPPCPDKSRAQKVPKQRQKQAKQQSLDAAVDGDSDGDGDADVHGTDTTGNQDGRKFNRGADHRRSYTIGEKLEVLRMRDAGLSFDTIKQRTNVQNVNMIKRWCSTQGRESIMVKYRKSLSSAHGADVVDAASPAASSDQLVTEGDERQSVAAAMAAINARLQVIDEARRAGALHEADAEGAPSSSVGSGGSVDGTDHPVMGSLAALLRESQHQLGRASDSEAARGKVVEDIPVSPVHTDDGRNPVLGGRVKAFEVAAVLNLPMVKKGRDSSITMAINDMMLRRNPFNLDSSSRATLPQGESFDSVRSCPQPHVVSSDEGGPSLAVRTLVAAAAAAAAGSHSPPADTLVRTAAATGQQPSFGMSVTRQTTRPVLPNTKYLVDRKRSLSAAAARNQRKDAPKRKSSRIDTSSFIDQMSGARPGNGTMRELIDHIAASDDEEEDGGSSTISNADENEDEDEDDTVVKMLGEK